jgi:hypothetical protein
MNKTLRADAFVMFVIWTTIFGFCIAAGFKSLQPTWLAYITGYIFALAVVRLYRGIISSRIEVAPGEDDQRDGHEQDE